MDFLISSFAAALRLIGSLSPDVVDAVGTSLAVSAGATVFAALFGIPVGLLVGLSDFPLKRFVVTVLNTLMAVPTVVVGLLVYGFLSRQGPLGALGLLFTPTAIVIAGSCSPHRSSRTTPLPPCEGPTPGSCRPPSRWAPVDSWR